MSPKKSKKRQKTASSTDQSHRNSQPKTPPGAEKRRGKQQNSSSKKNKNQKHQPKTHQYAGKGKLNGYHGRIMKIDISTSFSDLLDTSYEIGGGDPPVEDFLEIWHEILIDQEKKREVVMNISDEEIWQAARRLFPPPVVLTGTIDGQQVLDLVKRFMHGIEARQGKVKVGEEQCTVVAAAVFDLLEQRLLKERGWRALPVKLGLVALFVAWHCPGWWPLLALLGGVSAASLTALLTSRGWAARELMLQALAAFFRAEPLAERAHWKVDCYVSALMMLRLVKDMRHYCIVAFLVSLPFVLSTFESYTKNTGPLLAFLIRAMGWLNKVILLWFARWSYIGLGIAACCFFPQQTLLAALAAIVAASAALDLAGGLLWRAALPAGARARLQQAWGAAPALRWAVHAALAGGLPAAVWATWDWRPLAVYPLHALLVVALVKTVPGEFVLGALQLAVQAAVVVVGCAVMLVVGLGTFVLQRTVGWPKVNPVWAWLDDGGGDGEGGGTAAGGDSSAKRRGMW